MTPRWHTTSAGRSRGAGAKVAQPGLDAVGLLGERLAAGVAEGRVGQLVAAEALGVLGLDLGERPIRPVAGVGLGEARILLGHEADARADDLGRLAGAGERAADERPHLDAGDGLGELAGLGAARVVERHRQVALEAALRVVGRLPVAGQVDHGTEFAANAPGPPRR